MELRTGLIELFLITTLHCVIGIISLVNSLQNYFQFASNSQGRNHKKRKMSTVGSLWFFD